MPHFRRALTAFKDKISLGRAAGLTNFIFIMLVLASASFMPLVFAPTEETAPFAHRISAIGALILMGWRWNRWRYGDRLYYADHALEALALVMLAVSTGDSMAIVGIIYTALYYRPLVGSLRWSATGALTSVIALFIGTYFAHHDHHTLLSGEVLGQIPMLTLTALLGYVLSFTIRRQDQLAGELIDAERQYRSLVEQLPEAVFTLSLEGNVTYLSPQASVILGQSAAGYMGATLDDVEEDIHQDDLPDIETMFRGALSSGDSFETVFRFHSPARGMLWLRVQAHLILNSDGSRSHWLGTIGDVTERKELEDQLAYQAQHDNLTGLANRTLFRERVEHARERADLNGEPIAVLFLDIDHFKIVNDSLGHYAGDELIQLASQRLQTVVRKADSVARIGGDEFVVLLEDLSGDWEALQVANRILETLSADFNLKGQTLNVSASIGIVVSADRTIDADELIRRADLAMYAAKRDGRARYALFSPSMAVEAEERLEIETRLRRALQLDQLAVHFQPVIDLQTGKVSEVEALVRWNHPERGLLFPDAFLDVAEETGLIRAIDLWVLRRACEQVYAWQIAWPHLSELIASVNLSPSQLREATLSEEVAAILDQTGLEPRHLKLEITEHAMVSDIQQAKHALLQLSRLGVRLAIDDFGTGNSALNYLREFPVDTLKIDRSFITGLGHDGGDPNMVRALITLASSLGLQTTAEGIEGDEYQELRRFGCDFGQGYLFSRPQEPAVLEEMLWYPHAEFCEPAAVVEIIADLKGKGDLLTG